jgi:anti-sigma factor RsiW
MIAGIDRDQRHGRWISYINLPTVGVAATLFGLVGYPLAKYSSLGPLPILAIAIAAALVGAGGMVFLIAGWAVPSAAREVEDERFILQGHFAHVIRAILADQPGEIEFEHEGKHQTLTARGLDGREVAQGTDVVIERVEEGVAYVELWSTIAQQLKLPQ